jgi:hypothetical protein
MHPSLAIRATAIVWGLISLPGVSRLNVSAAPSLESGARRLDFSCPKTTCDSFCAAIRAESVAELEQCLTHKDVGLSAVRRAIARHVIAQHHLSKVTVEVFGAARHQKLPYVDYTIDRMQAWSLLLETASVTIVRDRADVSIPAHPPATLHLIREHADWKLALLNINEPQLDLLRASSAFRRVTCALLQQETLALCRTARLVQDRTLL